MFRAERQPGEGRRDRAQETTGPLPPSLSGVFKAQSVYGMYPGFLWADPGWGGPDVGRQLLSKTEVLVLTHPSGSSRHLETLAGGVPSHASWRGPASMGPPLITRAREPSPHNGSVLAAVAEPDPGPSTSPLASGRAGEGPWPCSLISNRN